MSLSLFGIILGLVLLMFLAYKGYSIIWVAPVCAVVVAVLSGYAILGALHWRLYEGHGRLRAPMVPRLLPGGGVRQGHGSDRLRPQPGQCPGQADRPRFAVAAVVIPCLLMTYGGISLFVVVFVIYPMGYSIYRAADLPRTLLPGPLPPAFGITMTAVPGTPRFRT